MRPKPVKKPEQERWDNHGFPSSMPEHTERNLTHPPPSLQHPARTNLILVALAFGDKDAAGVFAGFALNPHAGRPL